MARRGVFVTTTKNEPPAQAGEPEVVQFQYQDKDGDWHNFISQKHHDDTVAAGGWPIRGLITLPSHREAMEKEIRIVDDHWQEVFDGLKEAIAKKDAALKAQNKAAIKQLSHLLFVHENRSVADAKYIAEQMLDAASPKGRRR